MNTTFEALQHNLKGFSGYKLEVFRDDQRTFVRKTAQTSAQNTKLRAETAKLTRLAQLAETSDLFRVPAILNYDTNEDGTDYYDSEFVPSWELGSHLGSIDTLKITRIAQQLADIVNVFASTPIETERPLDEFEFILGKLRETAASILKTASDNEPARDMIAEYCALVEQIRIPPDFPRQTSTFCHGDFALDNILIDTNNRFYLIDPLINDFECYLWDVSKVFQSSFTYWQSIKQGDFVFDWKTRKIRLRISERISIFNEEYARIIEQRCHSGTVLLYLATTLARVVKYWKTSEQLGALLALTNALLTRYIQGEYALNEPLSPLRR